MKLVFAREGHGKAVERVCLLVARVLRVSTGRSVSALFSVLAVMDLGHFRDACRFPTWCTKCAGSTTLSCVFLARFPARTALWHISPWNDSCCVTAEARLHASTQLGISPRVVGSVSGLSPLVLTRHSLLLQGCSGSTGSVDRACRFWCCWG